VRASEAYFLLHTPATRLITSHYTNLSGEGFPFIMANEYREEDVNKFTDLAGSRRPVAAVKADAVAASELCGRLQGFDRKWELLDAIADGTARVVEHAGRISGYATGFGYGWHAVAETNDDLKAVLGSAERFLGLGVPVPSRNAELLGWALESGLRIVQSSTLMTLGSYRDPNGAYSPSILF
jgi:hypothetical protein